MIFELPFLDDILARFRRWLTFRRVLGIMVFLVLLLCFRYFVLMGMDLAFVFGLDLGLVTEVAALLIVLAVRDHVAMAVYGIRRGLLRLGKPGT